MQRSPPVAFVLMILFWLPAAHFFTYSTFPLLYLFWIFLCVFHFLNLQDVSPDGNVLGRCSTFALDGHRIFLPFCLFICISLTSHASFLCVYVSVCVWCWT